MDRWRASRLPLNAFCRRWGIPAATLRRLAPAGSWKDAVRDARPKQSMYRLGRSFEWRVRDLFRSRGYLVIRAAQSKGIADLCAVRDGRATLIQCKRGGAISLEEWDALWAACVACGAIGAVASRPDGRITLIRRMTGPGRRSEPWSP